MRTAAAVPDRIGAGASFHGGGLVTKAPDSPHLLIPTMKAHFLFAIAENDDQREPEAKNVLREWYATASFQQRSKSMRARRTDGVRRIRRSQREAGRARLVAPARPLQDRAGVRE
jgi:dienelactone hydrolase